MLQSQPVQTSSVSQPTSQPAPQPAFQPVSPRVAQPISQPVPQPVLQPSVTTQAAIDDLWDSLQTGAAPSGQTLTEAIKLVSFIALGSLLEESRVTSVTVQSMDGKMDLLIVQTAVQNGQYLTNAAWSARG